MINQQSSDIERKEAAGMKGLIIFGRAGESVLQFPVTANRVGLVLADGLNPVAAAVEAGIKVVNHSMRGVIDLGKLEHFWNCKPVRS